MFSELDNEISILETIKAIKDSNTNKNNIISLAEKHIPNKYVTVRNAEPMWLNSQLRRMIRKRKRLFNKAKRTKLSQDMNTYKQYRNEITNLIRKSKKSLIDEIANKLKT